MEDLDFEDSSLDGIKGNDIDDELEELEDILTELDAYEKKKLDEGKREQAVLPGGAKKNSALQQALQQVKEAYARDACAHTLTFSAVRSRQALTCFCDRASCKWLWHTASRKIGLPAQVSEGASKLDLSHWSIRLANDGVSVLAESLQRTQRQQLLSIILNNNDIGPAGATSLSSALSKNATLTRISLTSNVLGDSGAGAIARALKSNNTLRSLDLEENGIGQQGATALAEALVTNRGLESLHLSENPFGDAGAVSLGNSLSLNSTLVTMWLGGNNIGLAGGRALSESLKKNSTLKTLHLGTPRLGHAVSLSSL